MKRIALSLFMLAACGAMQAQTNYQVLHACHPADVKHYDNEQLRSRLVMALVFLCLLSDGKSDGGG